MFSAAISGDTARRNCNGRRYDGPNPMTTFSHSKFSLLSAVTIGIFLTLSTSATAQLNFYAGICDVQAGHFVAFSGICEMQ